MDYTVLFSVYTAVLGDCAYLQVFNSIVVGITIDVMDDFASQKWSAQMSFHNDAVGLPSFYLEVGLFYAASPPTVCCAARHVFFSLRRHTFQGACFSELSVAISYMKNGATFNTCFIRAAPLALCDMDANHCALLRAILSCFQQ